MNTNLYYEDDGYKVTFHASGNVLMIKMFVDDEVVELQAAHSETDIRFNDITGNGYFSKLWKRGTGSFLVNLALQYFDNHYTPSTPIEGTMSRVDDPKEPKLAKECEEYRIAFWSSFGEIEMERVGIDGSYIDFTTMLGSFRPKNHGSMLNGRKRYVPLGQFKNNA